MVLSSEKCNLGQIDLEAVQNEVEKVTELKKKRGAYFVYSPEERFNIAKYAVENGTSRPVHHFKRKYPSLNESTVRTFKAKYEREKKAARFEKDNRYKKYVLNHEEDQQCLGLLMRWFKAILRFVYCILYLFSY